MCQGIKPLNIVTNEMSDLVVLHKVVGRKKMNNSFCYDNIKMTLDRICLKIRIFWNVMMSLWIFVYVELFYTEFIIEV